MKNKEKPSGSLSRGNHRKLGDPSLPEPAGMRTTGSPVRPDDTATAPPEKPTLSKRYVQEANPAVGKS